MLRAFDKQQRWIQASMWMSVLEPLQMLYLHYHDANDNQILQGGGLS